MLTSLIPMGLVLLLSAQAAAQAADREPPAAEKAGKPVVRAERDAGDAERPRTVRPSVRRPDRAIRDQPRPAGRPTFGPRRARPAQPGDRARRASSGARRVAPPRERAVPRRTRVMRLRHHPATDTRAVIEEWLENQGQESDRLQAKVISDAVSNCLVISGSEEQLDVIRSIVEELDQPIKSIRLKALLAELALSEAPQPGTESTTSEVIQGDIGQVVAKLKERGELRVLARPELLTTNNQPAFLQLGYRIPRITGTSVSRGGRANTMQLENVGTILGVTGRVADENSVALEIDLERSHLEPEEEGAPLASDDDGTTIRAAAIQTLTLQTTVSVRSGQTVLIGGIVYHSEQGWREVLLLLQVDIE